MVTKKRGRGSPAIAVFSALNFVLAGLCLVWILLFVVVLIYGVFYSGDKGKDLIAGVMGTIIIVSPGLIGIIIYLVGGLGLLKRWTFGYYVHLVGAVLAGFSCVGLVYTVFAFVYLFRPEFSEEFFPESVVDPDFFPEEEEWK